MWTDTETSRDFLNFGTIANTAAEMIRRAGGKPLSMGISGGWGVGKSSMVKLIQESLQKGSADKFIFVDFNAWLYQGFDDAKAALLEVIARRLLEHATEHKKPTARILEFLGSVNWVRAAGLTARVALAVKTLGISELAIAAGAKALEHGNIDEGDVDKLKEEGKEVLESAKGVLREKKADSPPKEIHDLRSHFSKLLADMDVTLVVFVDDLDRCLPDTAISTLEAMRLFLFMDHTAFVIAADEKMIRQAVKAHFGENFIDEEQVTSYFDKLIQVPLRVPPLGTQEVRAYLFLLFIENSDLSQNIKDKARESICSQLGNSWQGKRVDREFVVGLFDNCPPALVSQFELADRIAPLMTAAPQIRGNPRLIKRFLNTLHLRLAAATAQKVTVDEAVLAKLLLFERCGQASAHADLLRHVNEHEEGKPTFLKVWEEAASKGELSDNLSKEWDGQFERDWLALPPLLSEVDLRPVVYVSREHMAIITRADSLSPEAAQALDALVRLKQAAPTELTTRLKALGKRELNMVMEYLLVRAKQVQEWGATAILHACLAVVTAEKSLADKLSRFLMQVPVGQLRASIVPLLKDKIWREPLLKAWLANADTPSQVKKAIKAESPGIS
jgi:predicted KAP-like P-loop ATPase